MKSKIVVVFYNRKRLHKELVMAEVARTASRAIMSIGNEIDGDLVIRLSKEMPTTFEDAEDKKILKAIPERFYSGTDDTVAVTMIDEKDSYDTLYEWCVQENVPVARSKDNTGEDICMVIGPYWDDKISELINRSIPEGVRVFGEGEKRL